MAWVQTCGQPQSPMAWVPAARAMFQACALAQTCGKPQSPMAPMLENSHCEKPLILPMSAKPAAASRDHIMFGPKTMARLFTVILLRRIVQTLGKHWANIGHRWESEVSNEASVHRRQRTQTQRLAWHTVWCVVCGV